MSVAITSSGNNTLVTLLCREIRSRGQAFIYQLVCMLEHATLRLF